MNHASPDRRPLAVVVLLTLALLGALSACSDSEPAPGAAADTAPAPSDAVLFPDAATPPDAAGVDTVPSGDAEAADVADVAVDATPPSPCAASPCDDPNRSVCAPDPTEAAGYRCDCDDGYALLDGACVSAACDDERVRSWLTLYDQTPLPNTSDPVRVGFDPLLRGDRARVVVELRRDAGASPLRVVVFTQSLAIDAATVRLGGAPTDAASVVGERQLDLLLPASFTSGRLAFDATVTELGPPLVAADARAFTPVGCPIDGSASGARLQLAGTPDPKHTGCNDLTDLRSLQLTDAIPDKNTSVYEQRNGTLDAISSAHKILTQMTLCLLRRDERTVSLAGSADGTRPWTIDNFLLLETFATDPQLGPATRTGAYLTTSTSIHAPGAFADGSPITILKHASLPGDLTGGRSPSAFSFPAGTLQLDALLPVGQQVWVRFTGLDTGVAGHLSRLFITSADPDAAPAECRSHLDCPLPTSTNGSSIAIRSGCVDGACTPVACGAGCPLGQRCLQGFCTDGCTSDAGCPGGQVCGQGQCVTLGAGGCRSFADCPVGEVCLLGRCEAGCFHPVAQNPTYTDNHGTYSLCRTSPAACPRCPAPTDRCWFNYCRECELDAHCPTGEVCADFTCTAP